MIVSYKRRTFKTFVEPVQNLCKTNEEKIHLKTLNNGVTSKFVSDFIVKSIKKPIPNILLNQVTPTIGAQAEVGAEINKKIERFGAKIYHTNFICK